MISIVIPTYNEAECIEDSTQRLLRCFSHYTSLDEVEFIFVNDGSTDRTSEILERAASNSSKRIQVITFSRNFGHSAAVYAGLKHASGEKIAIIDADMQDPPELLPAMFDRIGKDADVVYGKRISRMGESILKRLTAYLFYRVLILLSGVDIPADTGDFRVMKRKVVDALLSVNEQDPFVRGLVSWVGFKQIPFEYERQPRSAGKTKYPYTKMFKFATKAIISFSTAPLIISLLLGMIGLFFCLVILTWAFMIWISGISVPGWASMMMAFLTGQSLTLIILGVIGAYIGRILQEVKSRPIFIIDKEHTK